MVGGGGWGASVCACVCKCVCVCGWEVRIGLVGEGSRGIWCFN